MSDLSGSGSEKGYHTYLTGYPLPEIKKFAFARTWYAREMSRPGCVWTHTLLVSFSDLAYMNPLRLSHLFERPSPEVEHRAFYQQTLCFSGREGPAPSQNTQEHAGWEPELTADGKGPRNQDRVAKALIEALYGETARRPVLVIAPSSAALDQIVLRVWNQQWPGLKRKFTFCTGSLSGREVNGKPLALQVTPLPRKRAVERASSSASSVVAPFNGEDRGENRRLQEQWIEVAAEDLKPTSDFTLREYLRSFGPDVESGRAAFRPLTESFIASKESRREGGRQASMVDLLGENFPRRAEAGKLKREALSKQPPLFPGTSRQEEKSLLCKLATTNLHEAFDYESLGVDRRVREACSETARGGTDILRCLLKDRLNFQGKRMLDVAISASEIDDIVRLGGEMGERWWPAVLDRQPLVATKPAFWKEVRGQSEACVEVLFDELGSDREAWCDVVAAALVAGVDEIAKPLEATLDFATLAFIDGLDKVEGEGGESLSYKWKRLARRNLPAVETWLAENRQPKMHTALFVASVFSPYRINTGRSGLQAWENVVEKAGGSNVDGKAEEILKIMAFALALGFRSEKGHRLLTGSFQRVHRAVAESKLTWRSWRWVDQSLPRARRGWKDIFDWDRCEKLRRGLVHCWSKREWPPEDLLEAAESPATLRKVLNSMTRTRRGRELLHKLEKSLADGRLGYRSALREDVLKDFFGE